MVCESPILLIAFRRPRETAQTLRSLAKYKPKELYVWIDAPRNEDEADLVGEVKAVVDAEVNWGVKPTVFMNSVNDGMTKAFGNAIDWFFSHVDEGIIIEDDCVVGNDFLPYCEELLARYRHDSRVLAIMGDNAAEGRIFGRASYAFIPDFSVWGWATWKRVWDMYDYSLSDWPELRSQSALLKQYWPNKIQRNKWMRRFDQLHSDDGELQESNWRFMLIGLKTLGLFILPRNNLITNIGVDESLATSGTRGHVRTMHQARPILPLRHPRRVRPSWWTNRTVFFSRKRNNRQETIWFPLKKKARKTMKRLFATLR